MNIAEILQILFGAERTVDLIPHEFGEADDRIERSAQLVTDIRKEITLGAVRGLGLLFRCPQPGLTLRKLVDHSVEAFRQHAQHAPRGLDRYAYELLPRVYRSLLALLFYRWEVIMRETAILGILGITTLGFYVDGAFAELRFDRAIFLIGVTALLNIAINIASRRVRTYLRLRTALEGR